MKIIVFAFLVLVLAVAGCVSQRGNTTGDNLTNAEQKYQEYYNTCVQNSNPLQEDSEFAQECVNKGGCYMACGSGCGHVTPEFFKGEPKICPAVCKEDCLEPLK